MTPAEIAKLQEELGNIDESVEYYGQAAKPEVQKKPMTPQETAQLSQQLDNIDTGAGYYGTMARRVAIFVKLAQAQLQTDSSLIIQNALYSRYENPPMKLINSISDKAYESGGSVSLLVSTVSQDGGSPQKPKIEFTSNNNPLLASELNARWRNDIAQLLISLQKTNPNIPANEWSFFAKDFVILGQ